MVRLVLVFTLLLCYVTVSRCDVTDAPDTVTDMYDDVTDDNVTTPAPEPPKRCVWGNAVAFGRWLKSNKDYIVLSIGVFGNALSLIVNGPKMSRRSPSYYMAILAMADTLVLIIWPALHLLKFQQISDGKIDPGDSWGNAACKIIKFLEYFSRGFAVNVLVVMTIERALIVLFPLKLQSKIRVRNSVIILGAVALFFAAFDAPTFAWGFELVYRKIPQCVIDGETPGWLLTDLVLTIFLPSVVLFLCNLIIIVRMKIVADKQEEMTNDTSKKSKAREQFMQISIQTLTVSISFVLLTLLFFIQNVPGSPFHSEGNLRILSGYELYSPSYCWFAETSFLYTEIANFLYTMNHAINGYLYCVFSRMFRKELVHNIMFIFCRARLKKQKLAASGVTSSTNATKSISTVT